MRHLLLLTLLASLAVLSGCQDDQPLPFSPDEVVAEFAWLQTYDVQLFDIDIQDAQYPRARGINARGDIVGYYFIAGSGRGFLWSDGDFETILYPDPATLTTAARGINERGDIVGTWGDGTKVRGFVRRDGEYAVIDNPDAVFVVPEDINASGEITGFWRDQDGWRHGFVVRNGEFTSFDVDAPGVRSTVPYGINPQGDIVGYYDLKDSDGNTLDRPFVRRPDGTFVTGFEHPEPGVAWIGFNDINARGDISGWYYPPGGSCTGFVLDKDGHYTVLSTPLANRMDAFSINSSGVVVGRAWNPGPTRIFVARPLSPMGT